MNTILDAIQAAQERNTREDRLRQLRQQEMAPVLPTGVKPVLPLPQQSGGNGFDFEDTRTPHQQYLDAIDANQYIGAVPVVGRVLGALNDSFIENYEMQNPNKVVGGGLSKYSTLGRIAGKGMTVEEQIEAKKAGLGLGKMLGFGDQKSGGGSQPGYTLFDRIFGSTPMNIANEADYIGSFPQDGGGYEGGPIGGYEQEDLSFDSFAGPTGYA